MTIPISQELYALIVSKRFWAAISGLLLVVLKQFYPDIDEATVNNVVMLIAAWVVGDSMKPTTDKIAPPEVTPTEAPTSAKGIFPSPAPQPERERY